MKKIIISLITAIFTFSNGLSVYAVEFDDVTPGFWAYIAVKNMSDADIVSGNSENMFQPSKLVTRAEYAKALVKVTESENIKIEKMYSFDDIDNKNPLWKYVIRAVNLDMITPVDDSRFNPNGYVTRADVITFLVNILKTENISKKEAITALQNKYTDFDDIPDWFKVTAGKAEVLGVIANEPFRENYLDCDENVTKAQLAVFMNNLKEKLNSYKEAAAKAESSPKIGEGITIENTVRTGDVVLIPQQTVLPIVITGRLNSKTTEAGQMFNAKFLNNIVDNEHHILFSKDIILTGRILDSTKARHLLNNGGFIIDLSSTNKNNNLVRIYALAECKAVTSSGNKFGKAVKTAVKGKNLVITEQDVVYVKLYKPVRVNIVTGEVLDSETGL